MNKLLLLAGGLTISGAVIAYLSGQGLGTTIFLGFIGAILLIIGIGIKP